MSGKRRTIEYWDADAPNLSHTEYSSRIPFVDSESPEIQDQQLPSNFSLKQNYPNPFNPETTIRYALPEASEVRLELFNILGQRVAVLIDSNNQAGRHNVRFNASHLSSGIYIYIGSKQEILCRPSR